HVDSAADRELVVDNGDLLVVTAPDRMGGVELEIDSPVRKPANEVERHRAAREELERADAPFQDADLETLVVGGQPGDETAEPGRIIAAPRPLPPAPPAREVDAGVDVPPDQQDALARLEHRLLHEIEIVRR